MNEEKNELIRVILRHTGWGLRTMAAVMLLSIAAAVIFYLTGSA